MMTGKQARNLLDVMRERWNGKTAFFKAADQAGLTYSEFGKLLHMADDATLQDIRKKEQDRQLNLF